MADLSLAFGGDLGTTATGDLLLATSYSATDQRIIRRLLTYPGGMLWHQDYGAGLGAAVGRPAQSDGLRSAIYGQLRLEAAVATTSSAKVILSAQQDGVVFCTVEYVAADGSSPRSLAFSVGG